MWPFADNMALVYDAVAAAQFTQVKSLPKFKVLKEYLDPLTDNLDLISTNHETWKDLRSIFSPGFSSKNITSLLPELIEEVSIFVDRIKKKVGQQGKFGPVFALQDIATDLTFDVIGRIAL